jgi:hypothetical protein
LTRSTILARANVDERARARAHAAQQVVGANGFHGATLVEVLAGDLLDFGQARLRQGPQVEKEVTHLWVRQAVRHV